MLLLLFIVLTDNRTTNTLNNKKINNKIQKDTKSALYEVEKEISEVVNKVSIFFIFVLLLTNTKTLTVDGNKKGQHKKNSNENKIRCNEFSWSNVAAVLGHCERIK